MNFQQAMKKMENGRMITLPTALETREWYWYMTPEQEIFFCQGERNHRGRLLARYSVEEILKLSSQDKWVFATHKNCPHLIRPETFHFQKALTLIKQGKKVARMEWADGIYMELGQVPGGFKQTILIGQPGPLLKDITVTAEDFLAEDWYLVEEDE